MKVIMEMKGQIMLSGECILCNKHVRFQVSETGYLNWTNGMNIQDALPEISTDKREMMLTNICGICFDRTFNDEELCEEDYFDGDETDKL